MRRLSQTALFRLSEGETLTVICKDENMSTTAVRNWVRDDKDGFAEKYALARQLGYEVMADEILDIADEPNSDTQANRLRVDTRKWLLSKCLPKIYGNKTSIELTDTSPKMSLEERKAAVRKLLAEVEL